MAVPPIVHAERRVAREFRSAGATSPDTARPFSATGPLDGRALDRLLGAGAVRESGPGRYWLDLEGYGAYRGTLRKRALTLLALALFVVLVLALATGLLRQPPP